MQKEQHRSLGRARWLMLLTGLLMLVEVGAAVRALQIPGELIAQVSLPVPLEFIGSAVWALFSGLACVLLLKRQRGAVRYAAWLLVGFILFSAARLLLFTQADYDRQRLPFLLVVFFIILIIPAAYAAARPTEAVDGRKPQD